MLANFIGLFIGIHENQKQDQGTYFVLAILSWANLTSETEDSKHSLLVNVKGFTDFFILLFLT